MSTVDDEIRELEKAQDERAKILGYTLIRMWPHIVEPTTRFVTKSSAPEAAALFKNERVWSLLGSVRHEVGRHAQVNAWHQEKIDKLREAQQSTE